MRGAPNLVVSDRAKAEISRKVEEVLRRYIIDAHQSEPYQQQQNPVERFVQDIKRYTNYVHTYSGAPPESWVHIVQFVIYVMNRSARSTLNYRMPYEKLYGQTPDISIMTKFLFWEPVLVHNHVIHPLPTRYSCASLGLLILLVTQGVIRYIIPRLDKFSTGHYLNVLMIVYVNIYNIKPFQPLHANGENDDVPVGELVKSHEGDPSSIPIGIDNMINHSFLLPPNEDGSRQRALITGVVEEFQGQLDSNPDRVHYKARIGENKFEELIEYNDLMEMIEEQKPNDDGLLRSMREKILAARTANAMTTTVGTTTTANTGGGSSSGGTSGVV